MVIQYYSHFTNEKPKAWWNWKVVATQKFADHQWSVIARINIKVAPASPHYSLLTKDSKLGAEAWTECRLKIKRKLPAIFCIILKLKLNSYPWTWSLLVVLNHRILYTVKENCDAKVCYNHLLSNQLCDLWKVV